MRLLLVACMHIVRGDGGVRARLMRERVDYFGCAKWRRIGFDQDEIAVDGERASFLALASFAPRRSQRNFNQNQGWQLRLLHSVYSQA